MQCGRLALPINDMEHLVETVMHLVHTEKRKVPNLHVSPIHLEHDDRPRLCRFTDAVELFAHPRLARPELFRPDRVEELLKFLS